MDLTIMIFHPIPACSAEALWARTTTTGNWCWNDRHRRRRRHSVGYMIASVRSLPCTALELPHGPTAKLVLHFLERTETCLLNPIRWRPVSSIQLSTCAMFLTSHEARGRPRIGGLKSFDSDNAFKRHSALVNS